MRLSTLTLRHFRNLRNQELEVPPEGVALIGDNAQGKSNFLEAIYYLETLRSFRGARDSQMVAFGEDVFRVVGTTEAEGDEERRGGCVAAAFQRRGKQKKVTIDGSEPERLSDALGHLSAVIFSPADIDLVSGGPAERRRFLDIVLSLNEPGYLAALQQYRRGLQRRNASLKAGDPASLVSVWDDGLVRSGAEVVATRRRWIDGRSGAFGDYYRRVSGGAVSRMTYRSSVPLPEDDAVESVQEPFREALLGTRERERRMGVSVVGPHRDGWYPVQVARPRIATTCASSSTTRTRVSICATTARAASAGRPRSRCASWRRRRSATDAARSRSSCSTTSSPSSTGGEASACSS